jgi:hypothetical protein
MTNLAVRIIPNELVNQWMTLTREHIEAGLSNSDISFEQARVFLSNGSWHLLVALDEEQNIAGAYTLALANEPNDRVATIVTAGGRGLASQGAFDQVCHVAKSLGATKIQALATESGARLYKRAGLVEKAILMEKKLWAE